MSRRTRSLSLLLGAVAVVSAWAVPAQGALLVYEPYAGHNPGTLAGQYPNGNTVGLNTGAAYATYGGATATEALTSSGLTFGALPTMGGAESLTSPGAGAARVVTAQYSGSSLPTGSTLWSSMLAQVTSVNADMGSSVFARVQDAGTSSTNPRFITASDAGGPSASGAGIRYQGTATTPGMPSYQVNWDVAAPPALELNTTYMLISKFTNLGVASGGQATLWVLTADQFTAFVAAGQTEDYLNGEDNVYAAVTQGAQTSSTGNVLNTGNFIALATFGKGVGTEAGVFDELRLGTTLADVTPVPEPASALLLAGGIVGLLGRVRRARE
ncbi:MAG: PEP-CTERM sorting domain-containing protein [Planctomycetes bacterium]|nr:PEP-CTERM sorting domain-containing protein [Planctomycetota bacterium]